MLRIRWIGEREGERDDSCSANYAFYFQVHAYRAALETILIKYDKRLRRCQVRNVKVTKSMTFEELSVT